MLMPAFLHMELCQVAVVLYENKKDLHRAMEGQWIST